MITNTNPAIATSYEEKGMTLSDFAFLTDLLATLYPDSGDARRVLNSASVPVVDIELTGSPRKMWWSFMGFAVHNLRSLAEVVKFASKEYKDQASLHSYHEKLKFEIMIANGNVTLSPDEDVTLWRSIKNLFKKKSKFDVPAKKPQSSPNTQPGIWDSFELFERYLSTLP